MPRRGLRQGTRDVTEPKPDNVICIEGQVFIVRRDLKPDNDLAAVEAYLMSCVRRRDWHGVSDAANDLRVLEARLGAR